MTPANPYVTSNGTEVYFDRGSFDNWCVYVQSSDKKKYAPKDTEYFHFLKEYATESGEPKFVYDSFCKVYELAAKQISPVAGEVLRQIAAGFGAKAAEAELYLSVMYAAMVAEENKEFTKLGKRIKRLGVYQLLNEGLSPEEAANWSRKKPWRFLAAECQKHGF